MAPYTTIPLSAAELSYLHTSLTQNPPLRPDGRAPTQFRPLIAETDILPTANGSARICFADGSEAVVGVKAEVEKSSARSSGNLAAPEEDEDADADMGDEEEGRGKGKDTWLEIAIDIPGVRDDDAMPAFLAAMLSEALLADGRLRDRLWMNRRFHWRVFVDILLLSPPQSYPLPLLSLTTHLALLTTRLPALLSEGDEDPLFNDDWQASTYLYPPTAAWKPPITLLVMSVAETLLFEPTAEELAVADSLLAISAAGTPSGLRLVALRTIDPPSRLTGGGTPDVANTTAGGGLSAAATLVLREQDAGRSVWRPPRGGVRRGMVAAAIKAVLEPGGVGEEVLAGLEGVER